MEKITYKWFLFTMSFLVLINNAQNNPDAPLKIALSRVSHDTAKVRVYLDMIEKEPDILLWSKWNLELKVFVEKKLSEEKISGIEKIIYLKARTRAVYNEGFVSQQEGENARALKTYDRAMQMAIAGKDQVSLADILNNMGMIQAGMANFPLALDYYSKALAIREKLNDSAGISYTLNNMGMLYRTQGDPENAMKYFQKAKSIQTGMNDLQGLAATHNNIGLIYYFSKKIDSAIYEFNNSLLMYEKMGNKQGVATCLINMGLIKGLAGDTKGGMVYLGRSVAILDSIKDKPSMVSALLSTATMFEKNKNLRKAIGYSEQAMVLAKDIGFPREIRNCAEQLYKYHKQLENYKGAMEYYTLFVEMTDSLKNEEGRKSSIKSQLKYEYEKKAAADSVKVTEEKKVVQAQLKQEKTQRYSLYGGLALVLIFALFMVNRFRVTNKQKKLIEEQKRVVEIQKHLVEEKQREVLDSIRYAKRIQTALITSEAYIQKRLLNLNK